jgi:hypothetical protein
MTSVQCENQCHQVEDLSRAEQVFFWSLRVWYVSEVEGVSATALLRQVFARHGIVRAFEPFESLMRAMLNGLTEWPDIRCTHSSCIGDHELRMLVALASLQCGDEITARRVLRSWLAPTSMRAVIQHGRACVDYAREADLLLQPAERFARKSGLPGRSTLPAM